MNNVNDIRAFGLSQYATTSVTEVSNVDVDFIEAGLILLLFKLFMNNVNDIRAFGLSQYATTSVTEVSNVDVDFIEAGLMLILYQQHSPIDLGTTSIPTFANGRWGRGVSNGRFQWKKWD